MLISNTLLQKKIKKKKKEGAIFTVASHIFKAGESFEFSSPIVARQLGLPVSYVPAEHIMEVLARMRLVKEFVRSSIGVGKTFKPKDGHDLDLEIEGLSAEKWVEETGAKPLLQEFYRKLGFMDEDRIILLLAKLIEYRTSLTETVDALDEKRVYKELQALGYSDNALAVSRMKYGYLPTVYLDAPWIAFMPRPVRIELPADLKVIVHSYQCHLRKGRFTEMSMLGRSVYTWNMEAGHFEEPHLPDDILLLDVMC